MSILVTGGIGYIGSHTIITLLEEGNDIIAVDNLSNSSLDVLEKIELITRKKIKFYNSDVRDKSSLRNIFLDNKIDSVIHFAALKSVSESINSPIEYYDNNIGSLLSILDIIKEFDVKKFIFSSSATVYDAKNIMPVNEESSIGNTTNPYGTSKLIAEKILQDTAISLPHLSIIILRYFNPVGAHPSGLIGENPKGIPNNLIPYINQVAAGEIDHLKVYGNDYPTHDGTGIRDYIHVMDLAKGHLVALTEIGNLGKLSIFNLGTGVGYSVLDIIHTFEKVNSVKIPFRFYPRRSGDIAECWAEINKSKEVLNWSARYSLEDMLKDSWRFQKKLAGL
ncbi:UDP-glucose 4-epimerase GalE [Tatumella sp. UCD-D_suzukii]|uniref:UDP-glucose 4-epimerase GalE n=1 Tax=Tatumella sp. UCD-D_suzukii TaxID=1408192 RepID=UPI000571D45F|nr:UDP-glucose 4-epimerase GalE [Tatumella sp. UCD-D_suzukii]